MSQANERRRQQEAYWRAITRDDRPSEPEVQYSSDPTAWDSRCVGWRYGFHEQSRTNRLAGVWRCRWCGQLLNPPVKKRA